MFKRLFKNQRGSTTLFIAGGILPLLIFLFSFCLDFSRYYAASEQSQIIVDEAASYASRFLPYQAESAAAAPDQVTRTGAEFE